MSATSGTLAALAMGLNAAVDSSSGQETRTMSAPASSSWRTWSMVAAASAVRVLVIDWTEIGASPLSSIVFTRILCGSRQGGGHRLDGVRRIAADLDRAHADLARRPALNGAPGAQVGVVLSGHG